MLRRVVSFLICLNISIFGRVPRELKGPLDTFWHIRNKEGYILNNDGQRSVCVHQWDRYTFHDLHFFSSSLLCSSHHHFSYGCVLKAKA